MTFWGLVAWAVLGLLGLVLQTVYLFKDPLATYHPHLKPLLLEACQLVGCQIRPLQKTDAVVIDFSSVDAMSPDQAQEIHAFIRQLLTDKYGATVAEEISILYGGSCKPDNAKEIFSKKDVDGGLIGGAALKAEDFLGIVAAF